MPQPKTQPALSVVADMSGGIPMVPYDLDAENSLLAACMLAEDLPARVVPMLTPEDFFRDTNRHVWEAITELWAERMTVNLITVTQRLRAKGHATAPVAGSPENPMHLYLSTLIDDLPTTVGAEDYARIVADQSGKRRLIAYASKVAQSAMDNERLFPELLADAEVALREIARQNVSDGTTTLAEMTPEKMDAMMMWAENPHEASRATPTGLRSLDAKLTGGGLLPGKLYTIGGATSSGKSSLIRWILKCQAEAGIRVCLLSLEQDRDEVWEEVTYALARIDPNSHEQYGLPLDGEELPRFHDAIEQLGNQFSNFHVNDRPRLRPSDIRLILAKLKADHPDLAVVAIDYLHLMAPDVELKQETAQDRLSKIVTAVRDIAKEYNVACLLGSQLTKEATNRQANADLRPKLQHFRDTGVITQVSYCVFGLYTHDYAVKNGMLDVPPEDFLKGVTPAQDARNTMEIGILKQQRGEHGITVTVGFTPANRQIFDLEG
jgi:replicative DNA helicase